MLTDRYAEFEGHSITDKTSYVLSSDNWEDNFKEFSNRVHYSYTGSVKPLR